ncbi:IS5 family transposase, partial [Klebsiella pneumoniae]
MKDQITHLPDNADRSVAKQKFKITNWPTYNKALINRGSITFWLDDEAIQAWYESATPSSRGRPQRYSDLAITTVLVIKRVFRLTLRAAQGFIDSIFSLMNVPLRCPDYSCVSRRAKSVNVSFKTPTRGEIAHLVIDSTGLKVFGEGEWKVKKHGQERRRIWRKLHLAVDSKTHEIICADLSLNNVTDSEAFPGLIRQTHRKIRAASADGAYDTRLCHDELRRKKISALIPPRKGAGYWPGEYADRNRAVANQRLTGSNARWKWTTDYNRRSITFWLDDEAIQAWYESATPSSRGRPQRYSDLAITTVLVIKRVFRLTLRAAQGFIDSIFSLMNVPLRCPDYSC